jgi:hypothetical protein
VKAWHALDDEEGHLKLHISKDVVFDEGKTDFIDMCQDVGDFSALSLDQDWLKRKMKARRSFLTFWKQLRGIGTSRKCSQPGGDEEVAGLQSEGIDLSHLQLSLLARDPPSSGR